ncbi:putative ribonuclease H-like domain-containing protein [Tanacetum coccineum]
MVRCSCGLEAVIRTSWTNRNPGRRFYGCPTLSPTCVNFIRWFDPPMCQRFVQIIPGLLRSRNELEEILAMVEEKRLKLMKCLIISWVVTGYGVVNECCFELINGMNSFDDMELEPTNSGHTAKLPILKLGEYEMWAIRIKQYFQIQDYALWEVIENGDSWVSVSQTTEENRITVTKMSTPVTAEEKTKKKNDVKARGLLLLALPNEDQLTFSQYPDAKSMFAAIETRFEEVVSRLAILGVNIAQEDLNLKFLSSLPPEWNTQVVVWMNKSKVETMSIDDLYNNFKIVEQKIKKIVGTSSGGQNLAFMTAPNSSLEQIHEDDLECNGSLRGALFAKGGRAPRSKEGQLRNSRQTPGSKETMRKLHRQCWSIDGVGLIWSDLQKNKSDKHGSKWPFSDSEGTSTVEQTVTYRKNEVLFSEEVVVLKREVGCKQYEINMLKTEFEKVKQEKDGIDFKIEKFGKASKDLDQLLGSQITDKSKKGLGYNAVPPPHPLIYNRPNKLDLSYSCLDEFKEPEFKGYGPKDSKQESNVVCDKESENSKDNFVESLAEEQVSQDKSGFVESSPNVDKEIVFPVNKKVEFTKLENNEKTVKKSVRSRAAVNAAKLKAVHNVVKRNWFHDVKASACWVWRPKQKEILDNVSKHNKITTVGVEVDDSVVLTTNEEITLAQTLIQIKAAKPKVVIVAATTATTTRPKE